MAELATLVAAMEEKAAQLETLGYRVRFDLTDGGTILLDAADGQTTIHEAEGSAEADTILKLSSDNLAKLLAGRLSPMLAFSTGRLKLQGSQGVALKLLRLLNVD
ncbi:SCP2 sterol-binding domain-containing protein [Martelella sp. HB161492]|uniref:SCP2 sterol-binding domain-containing protein n=1 Tax=Martelella sp. HB161492 TaxID=2720726 RepID=UPI001590B67D|nr:SCP2 sterol-binding domain-containing protein [Martelella sp. HB161492]